MRIRSFGHFRVDLLRKYMLRPFSWDGHGYRSAHRVRLLLLTRKSAEFSIRISDGCDDTRHRDLKFRDHLVDGRAIAGFARALEPFAALTQR
jgi:hypothetical protein